MVILNLRSSKAVDRVAPAQPVPTITTVVLFGCLATYGMVNVTGYVTCREEEKSCVLLLERDAVDEQSF